MKEDRNPSTEHFKESFLPIVNSETNTLILGTMPGEISLNKREYYGNVRNQFWKIIFTTFGKDSVPLDFDKKIAFLQQQQLGLWDTLSSCERKGSLDIHIKNQKENDFVALFTQYPNIKRILFNGKESHKYFIKKFGQLDGIEYFQMPSTSPANTVPFESKLNDWKKGLLK
ncbi:DNA-deoxyinosine glycosylase [Flavobacterium sp. '19STA2R22 D10 B1']|uniref:DNA-deoxyinosine glycosylase n=1 Tax=Flavobacterium aerium TaxID=3037261 RepID=UPI00278BDA71|nr:DNA-deoxyinosine glycosylase [Flavobacterium sp. '19STA2R22 D10 B1']